MNKALKYREDIDGLRAIAVLSVVIFHFDFGIAHGGFVGVDVFFVISGYLITGIIVKELNAGRFSILEFYNRRFKRILPALLVVVCATMLAGLLLLAPNQLIDLSESAFATSIFSSNVLFYIAAGYFDTTAELKPLLHTWSLAVEEQYYLLFPPLMMLIARFNIGQYLTWFLWIGIVSLAISIIALRMNPMAAFYLSPARAWELMLGSILALNVLPNLSGKALLRNILAAVGLALIAYSIFFYSVEVPFPGLAAIPPTVGTALIIYVGTFGPTVVGSLISVRPMVFIGLISYSLYLWHWPVIVYAKIYLIDEIDVFDRVAIMGVAVLLAIFSWRYVERPFRNGRLLANRKDVFIGSAVSSAAIAIVSLGILYAGGMPNRYNYQELHIADANDSDWIHWGECTVLQRKKNQYCTIGKQDGQPTFFFWGDSHARAIATSVHNSARRHQKVGQMASMPACPPLLGLERLDRGNCKKFNEQVLDHVLSSPSIQTVFLSGRWALAATGTRVAHEGGANFEYVDLHDNGNSAVDTAELFRRGLKRTIDALRAHGKSVVLVSSVPEIGWDVPSINFIANIRGLDVNETIAPPLRDVYSRNAEVTSLFTELIADKQILAIIDPIEKLCDNLQCKVAIEGKPLYRDGHHLSTFGANYLAEIFDPFFSSAINNKP